MEYRKIAEEIYEKVGKKEKKICTGNTDPDVQPSEKKRRVNV